MADKEITHKLRIRTGNSIAVLHAPAAYERLVGRLPPGVVVSTSLEGIYDLVHAFFSRRADLAAQLEALKTAMADRGILWISYPKGGQAGTDLSRDNLRDFLEENELQAVSQVSIDATWSALRFKKLEE